MSASRGRSRAVFTNSLALIAGAYAITAHERVSLLEALQVSDYVANLIWVEPELRHGRMTRYDSFRERALQILDRIFEMQSAECRRDWKPALARLVDGMALRN
jgi:hypothetical protein